MSFKLPPMLEMPMSVLFMPPYGCVIEVLTWGGGAGKSIDVKDVDGIFAKDGEDISGGNLGVAVFDVLLATE
jgi:hypothetical protein